MANGQRPIFLRRRRRPSIDANVHGALFSALGLASMPGFAQRVAQQPLPQGVLELIKIAAGCEETLRRAAALTGQEPETVKAASIFYLRNALFFEGAEPRRMLGVAAGAGRDEMRLHMRWLMIWLHPDHAGDAEQAGLAGRVLEAWRSSADGQWTLPPRAEPPAAVAAATRPASRGGAARLIGTALFLLLGFFVLIFCFDPDIGLDMARAPASVEEASGGFQ